MGFPGAAFARPLEDGFQAAGARRASSSARLRRPDNHGVPDAGSGELRQAAGYYSFPPTLGRPTL